MATRIGDITLQIITVSVSLSESRSNFDVTLFRISTMTWLGCIIKLGFNYDAMIEKNFSIPNEK